MNCSRTAAITASSSVTNVPMPRRVTRVATGLLSYYAVSLILVPLVKNALPGAAGSTASCFVQMLYVSFIFPLCMKKLEKP